MPQAPIRKGGMSIWPPFGERSALWQIRGGGFLLFGVRDQNQRVAKPEDRIVGITLGGDLLRDFGHKTADLQPPVSFEATPRPILLPDDEKKGIFVVRIPESQRRPHMLRSTGAFYRRGDGGTAETMDFYQIRDLMLMRRLTLLENLKWEFEENIAAFWLSGAFGDPCPVALARGEHGVPMTPFHG